MASCQRIIALINYTLFNKPIIITNNVSVINFFHEYFNISYIVDLFWLTESY
jgi:hypothetical protein